MKRYKSRKLDYDKPVRVYRNLTMKSTDGLPWFSIMQNGKVVAHSQVLALHTTKFIVNELGRQRVVRDKKKYVHAFIEGLIWKKATRDLQFDADIALPLRVTYSPFQNRDFMSTSWDLQDPVPIAASAYVVINRHGVTATGLAYL